MKINKWSAKQYMLFDDIAMSFSPGINVIFGENSTGKTAIIKTLYSVSKTITASNSTKDDFERTLVNKMTGVFKPEKNAIGRLVSRKQGGNRSEVFIDFGKSGNIQCGFGNRQTNHIDLVTNFKTSSFESFVPIFMPAKEIISSTGNFVSLYEDYNIEIDETYYDLAKLLLRPLRKGKNTAEQTNILSTFSDIMNGDIVQKDNRFYLQVKGSGEFEMGLVSEGYRKLSTLAYLILSGSLSKESIIFWDEPENNMNPKMITQISNALLELAKMGVQIFITTHSYFIQQSFNLIANYPNPKDNIDIKFISLFKEDNAINFEIANTLDDIEHNSIMEEFDSIYYREQELMDD